MAGGPTPYADLVRVRVERVDPNGGFRVEDVSLAVGATADTFRVRDQDLVTVLPVVERSANTVTLDGYVRHPGEYEWRTGMRLSSLVTRDRLLTEADLEHVEFRRVDPVTLQAEVRTLSLRSVWDGTADLELRPLDAVTVYSGARLPASVTLDGEVVRPGRYSVMPGERLSAVLARAGGVTSSGSIRGAVFRRPSAAGTIRSQRRELLERRTIELDRQMQMAAGDTAALRAINVQRELLASLDASADVDRIAVSLDDRGRWVGGVRDLVLEDGDRITVPPLSATVTVLGSVMNPGTVAARKGAGVSDYVELAGGYARDADRRMSFVLRAGGDAVPIDKVGRVEPGDAVVVATRPVDTRSTSRALGNASQYLLQLATAAALVLAAVRP
jgi:protein involved in polysaccharide export with SLBB domain